VTQVTAAQVTAAQVTAALPGQSPEPEPAAQAPIQASARRPAVLVLGALFALTKPRIIELLLVTTLPVMLLAGHGVPALRLILVTMGGGALAAGCANTVNCVIDRDIDAVMRRTSRRPLVATGSRACLVRPAEAVASAVVLGVAATAVLALGANLLAAGLADAAIAFYVLVYTVALKRRSSSNIVIGGAAGCFPVLVGWAAVTGRVGWPAIVLFGVVFFWTPPHFWALAIKFRDDYEAAGVPMLPVVASPAVVARNIVGYSWAMVATSLMLTWWAGWIYGACAVALGGWFLVGAYRLRGQLAGGAAAAPMRLFHASIAYLTLLFSAVAVAALLPWR
jgi:protoheme IX farnesyltransferase